MENKKRNVEDAKLLENGPHSRCKPPIICQQNVKLHAINVLFIPKKETQGWQNQ